jgi:hypothetical protein
MPIIFIFTSSSSGILSVTVTLIFWFYPIARMSFANTSDTTDSSVGWVAAAIPI